MNSGDGTDRRSGTGQWSGGPRAWPDRPSETARRHTARRRRRRRAGLATAVAAVCAVAVAVPLLTRGPSGPQYRGPLAVGEREGVSFQLVGNTSGAAAQPVDVSTSEQALALKLLRLQLDGDDPNPVSSAMSLSIALSMLHLGARGETSQQIARLIGPAGASPESIAAGWRDLMDDMAAAAVKSKISLDSANSIWQQENFSLHHQFVDDLTAYLHSGVWQVDFAKHPERAADAVNHWVAKKTRNKITQIVTAHEISSWVLALVNAVYFKAPWQYPFGKQTDRHDFVTADGHTVSVDMLHGKLPVASSDSAELTAVQLPYVGGRFAALILEPKTQALTRFTSSLTPAALDTITRQLRSDGTADVTMPMLAVRSSAPLSDALRSLGMQRAFTPRAQFDGISATPTQVAAVKQLATLNVTAAGTEAAAATVIGVEATASPVEPRAVVIDRPYLFLIRDTQTGAILFSAAVQDPTRD